MEEKNKKCDCGGACGGECGSKCGNDAGCSCGGGAHSAMGVCGGHAGCGGAGRGMPHRFLARVAIILALLGFVFWSGVKIGELKSYFGGRGMMGGRGFYGQYMMGGNCDDTGGDAIYGPGMMRFRQSTTTPR